MWKYEIGLKKKTHDKTNFRGRKGQENNWRWRIRPPVWRGELSISFPPSVLMNVSSLLPPRFNYRSMHSIPSDPAVERAPVSSTVVKTFLEALERCPVYFQRDPAANYFCTSKTCFFFGFAPNVSEGAVAHLLTNSRPRWVDVLSWGRMLHRATSRIAGLETNRVPSAQGW